MLYVGEQNGSSTAYIATESDLIEDVELCPECGGFVGMLRVLPPITYEIEVYRFPLTTTPSGPGDEVAMPSDFLTFFQTRGFSGINAVYPMHLRKAKFIEVRQFPLPELILTRVQRAGRVDSVASKTIWEERSRYRCGTCEGNGIREKYGPIVLRESHEELPDIFRCWNLNLLMASSRLIESAIESGFDMSTWVPANTYRYSAYG